MPPLCQQRGAIAQTSATAGYVYTEGTFRGGPARDMVGKVLYGTFVGAEGWDKVEVLKGGKYFGGSGVDRLVTCFGGETTSVEIIDEPCPVG